MPTFPPLLPGEKLEKVNENISLIRKTDGLTFGTDAYLLAAYVGRSPNSLAVDLGSGTGILPLLLLAREKIGRAVAVEVQAAFGELIARNAALNQMTDRLTPLCVDLRELPSPSLPAECADIVLSNPPSMKADSGKLNPSEAKQIARHEICGDIRDFCRTASSILKYGGKFYCVYRPDRLVDLLDAMRHHGLEPKRMTLVHATANAAPSMVLVEAKKGAAPSLTLTRPLLLTEEDKVTQSEDAKRIYETCSFADFWKV
ncbi:MAG: SAM-dependent methyltransferase [Ruminococcaceae bacterium]|nr:SAM-dependent methyltransferase [Oscillospiraceae bacterium]